MSGYVYIIGNPVFKWYKIGKSIAPEVRVQDLGILLPFKVVAIGIWKAMDHTRLEKELHAKYDYCRINGEWFRFENHEVEQIFHLLPEAACVYPSESSPNLIFEKFTNIEQDQRGGRRIVGVRTEHLRGNFTLEERAAKRRLGEEESKRKRALKDQSFKLRNQWLEESQQA